MAIHYTEQLPDELAQIIMAESYDPELWYQLVTDIDGSYITAYNRETGERVNLSTDPDGIPDDYKLDVEEFNYLEEEIENIDNETDYSGRAFRWISVAVVVSSIIGVLSAVALAYVLLK